MFLGFFLRLIGVEELMLGLSWVVFWVKGWGGLVRVGDIFGFGVFVGGGRRRIIFFFSVFKFWNREEMLRGRIGLVGESRNMEYLVK